MDRADAATRTPERPHVVIVGAGFAGLEAAKKLGRAAVEVTLLDRRNHHLFQPLLYQVATAGLSAPDVAAPIRTVFRRRPNVTVLLAEVRAVEVERRRLQLDGDVLGYDRLLIATGAENAYFGHDAWARWAPGLKTIEDAFEVRRRVLLAFERAERAHDEEARTRNLTFVVVGGGPTGVELAGALREIAQRTLARDFRHFDPARARVLLLDAGPRVLPTFPEECSRDAERLLRRLGVEVRTDSMVRDIDAFGVTIDGERLPAGTVLWAAGVRGSPLAATLGAPLDRGGRVLVEPDLSVPGHPEILVAGDLAAVRDGDGWVPGVAPAAMQMGRAAADNILRSLRGRPTVAFRYHDKGLLATIGRSAAVARIGRHRFSGLLAWLLWVFIHILYLIGYRNRAVVLFDWAIAYFTYRRAARVILEDCR
jgi:NADH dehydrogenase